MKRSILPVLVVLGCCGGGCDVLQYRGASPNVRTFSEEPRLSQYYIGFDLEFKFAEPPTEPNHPDAEQASEPKLPEDTEILPRPIPEPPIPF
jgi:hypothetical protein